MTVTFANEAFGTGQASEGLLVGTTYTGTSLVDNLAPISLTGTVDTVGSAVSANLTLGGQALTGVNSVYDGFSSNGDGNSTYYFSGLTPTLNVPFSFAVTSGTIAPLNVGTSIDTTANVTAPTLPVVPCFVRGTLIRTERGEVAAEDLAIGDRVLTLGGDTQPVTWIGHRHDRAARYGANHLIDFWPVLFRAGSLGSNRPSRDLMVSPCHGMYVDGVRVAAWRLLNDVSIVRASAVRDVDYVHVELARHSILFAEGAPSESYFEFDGYHGRFDNRASYAATPPAERDVVRCGREVGEGAELDAIRAKLAGFARAEPVPA